MKQPIVQGLFPTPVMFGELGRPYTKDELAFVKKLQKETVKNTGNTHTFDTYLLNRPEMLGIKTILEEYIAEYYNNVLCVKDSVKPYITQSWINYTKPGEFHHRHAHPNSFVSGILYIDCDKEKDKIMFYSSESYQRIKPEIATWNIFNSDSWWFPVGTGDLVMFPSELEHMVEKKQGNNLRTSLSFNTFMKGSLPEMGNTLGNTFDLTELKL